MDEDIFSEPSGGNWADRMLEAELSATVMYKELDKLNPTDMARIYDACKKWMQDKQVSLQAIASMASNSGDIEIGKGSTSVVRLSMCSSTGLKAIKSIRGRQNVIQEAGYMSLLANVYNGIPYYPSLYTVKANSSNTEYEIHMRYISNRVAVHRNVTDDTRIYVIANLVAAVYLMHQVNLVHGDIKPANILLDTNDMPVLIDYGSSMMINGSYMNKVLNGYTVAYSPPEIYYSTEINHYARDIWALGLICYELLTGTYLMRMKDDYKRGEYPYEEIDLTTLYTNNDMHNDIIQDIVPMLSSNVEERCKSINIVTKLWIYTLLPRSVKKAIHMRKTSLSDSGSSISTVK